VQNGCPGWRDAAEAAIQVGDLRCLKCLHKLGCHMDISLGIFAAKSGQLQCLKYIHQSECPWDLRFLTGAAASSRLDCLKYACENGCPWWQDDKIAARIKDNRCFLYALSHGVPHDAQAQTRLKALLSQRQALVYSFGCVKANSRDTMMAHRFSQVKAVWDCMSLIEPELVKCIAQMAGLLE